MERELFAFLNFHITVDPARLASFTTALTTAHIDLEHYLYLACVAPSPRSRCAAAPPPVAHAQPFYPAASFTSATGVSSNTTACPVTSARNGSLPQGPPASTSGTTAVADSRYSPPATSRRHQLVPTPMPEHTNGDSSRASAAVEPVRAHSVPSLPMDQMPAMDASFGSAAGAWTRMARAASASAAAATATQPKAQAPASASTPPHSAGPSPTSAYNYPRRHGCSHGYGRPNADGETACAAAYNTAPCTVPARAPARAPAPVTASGAAWPGLQPVHESGPRATIPPPPYGMCPGGSATSDGRTGDGGSNATMMAGSAAQTAAVAAGSAGGRTSIEVPRLSCSSAVSSASGVSSVEMLSPMLSPSLTVPAYAHAAVSNNTATATSTATSTATDAGGKLVKAAPGGHARPEPLQAEFELEIQPDTESAPESAPEPRPIE